MTHQEYSLILKALSHYESCCVADEILNEARAEMAILAMGNNEGEMIRHARNLLPECRARIETVMEQITLLKARLITERDKAIADEAIS